MNIPTFRPADTPQGIGMVIDSNGVWMPALNVNDAIGQLQDEKADLLAALKMARAELKEIYDLYPFYQMGQATADNRPILQHVEEAIAAVEARS